MSDQGYDYTVRLDDLYDLDGALGYVNERLPAEWQLTMVGFRRHVYDALDRECSLFQLEPVAIGRRVYPKTGAVKAVGLVFTRRMLDAYLAAREHNRGHCVERVVTRPTDDERTQVLDWTEAMERMNTRLVDAGLKPVRPNTFHSLRHRGHVPARAFGGRFAVYTLADLEEAAERYIASRRPWPGRQLETEPEAETLGAVNPVAQWLGAKNEAELKEALARQAGE